MRKGMPPSFCELSTWREMRRGDESCIRRTALLGGRRSSRDLVRGVSAMVVSVPRRMWRGARVFPFGVALRVVLVLRGGVTGTVVNERRRSSVRALLLLLSTRFGTADARGIVEKGDMSAGLAMVEGVRCVGRR